MTFETWWADQVRDRKQPDDWAYRQTAKAAWNALESRMRFAGYVRSDFGESPADVGSICKVGGGEYRTPVYSLAPNVLGKRRRPRPVLSESGGPASALTELLADTKAAGEQNGTYRERAYAITKVGRKSKGCHASKRA